ncbi:MAG: DUF418 domain-containing protein [Bdellovibrionaceae bacterium]|nr:DUF418 domain-containing protein [Pseudobdellovibrionaceae bacterium]
MKKRYNILDALRGFALVGVTLVNAGTINSPFWMDTSDFAFKSTPIDFFLTEFIFMVFIQKSYPIFAFLFGLSAALMLERIPYNPNKTFLKRLFFLAIFGLLQVTFFYWGDILFVYALLGFALVALLKLGRKGIFFSACILLVTTFILRAIIYALGLPEYEYSDLLITPYATGSFLQILAERFSNYYDWFYWGFFQTENLAMWLYYAVYYIELFLFMNIGAYFIFYKDYFTSIDKYVGLFLKVALFSFIGILLFHIANSFSLDWINVLSSIKSILFICLYSSLFCLFYLKMGMVLQKAFSSFGRMALTWYLGFNALMSFILYGTGLGLYGSVGPSFVIGIGFVFLLFAFFVSPLWLNKFQQGPLEKFWRTLYSSSKKNQTVSS